MIAARTGLAVVFALAGALAGCKAIDTVRVVAPEPPVRGGAWSDVRTQATRRFQLYDRFAHRATATATYLSPSVREGRVERLAEWLGWTEEEKARRLAAERAEAQKYDDFLLSFYTADSKANDLDAAAGSVWHIALKLEAGDLVTRDATAIEPDTNLRGLFPYIGPFDVVYRVRFSKAPGAPLADRPFTLELASALGKMPLAFNDGTIGPDRPEGTPLPGK